ncbi:hypothetical protein ACHAXR_009366 [Thalassiosira sp. AJA248-18]
MQCIVPNVTYAFKAMITIAHGWEHALGRRISLPLWRLI